MTTCPRCNTPNASTSQFCITCGAPLGSATPQPYVAQSARQWLGVMTGRIVISVLGLWFIRMFLVRFSFIQNLYLPDVSMSVADIISMLIFLLIAVLLFIYAIDLIRVWPIVFPQFRELGLGLAGLVLLLFLTELFFAIQPLFTSVFYDVPDALLVIQLILTFIALVIVGWAFFTIYKALPAWLATLHWPTSASYPPPATQEEVHPSQTRKSR